MVEIVDPFAIAFAKFDFELDRFRQRARSLRPLPSLMHRIKSLFRRGEFETPCTVIIAGDVGLGKTELIQRLLTEVTKMGLDTIWLDWKDVSRRYPELVTPESVVDSQLNLVFAALRDHGLDDYLGAYKKTAQLISNAERKVTQALEAANAQPQTSELANKLSRLGAQGIRLLIGTSLTKYVPPAALIPDEMKDAAEDALSESLKTLAQRLARAKLNNREYEAYVNASDQLTAALAEGMCNASRHRPFAIFIDNFELISRSAAWWRYLAWRAGPRVMWVIATQTSPSLLEDYRSNPHLAAGLIDIQLVPLTAQEVEQAVNAHPLKQRPVSPGEVRVLLTATRGTPWALCAALELWYPGKQPGIEQFDPRRPERSIIGNAIIEQYLATALADERSRSILEVLSFSYDQDPIHAAHLLNVSDIRPLTRPIAAAYPFLFERNGDLSAAAAFWIRENLLTRSETPSMQDMATRALALCEVELSRIEAEQPDLADTIQQLQWGRTASAIIYYAFWSARPEAKKSLIKVLQACLWFDQMDLQGFIATIWETVGPLPRLRPALEQTVRAMQFGIADMVLDRDLPVSSSKFIIDGERIKNEFGEVIFEQSPRTIQAGLEALRPARGQDDLRQAGWLAARSRLALVYGDLDGAGQLLERAHKMTPETAPVTRASLGYSFRSLGRSYGRYGGRPAIAANYLNTAVELTGRQPALLYDLALAHLDNCEYEKAVQLVDEIVEQDPNNGDAHNLRATALLRQGRSEEAQQAYEAGLAIDVNPFARSILHTNLGILHMQADRYEVAEQEFDAALESDPQASFTRLCKSLLMQVRNPELALQEFEMALRYVQFVDQSYVDNVIQMLVSVDDTTAIRFLEQLLVNAERIAVSPYIVASLHTMVGVRRANQRKWKEALAAYERARITLPQYVPAYIHSVQALGRLRQPDRARHMLLRALELDVGSVSSFGAMTLVARGMDMSNKALRDELRGRPVANTSETHIQKGVLLLLEKKYREAAAAFTQAARISQADFWPYYFLWMVEMERGQYKKAAHAITATITTLPDDRQGFAYYARAVTAEAEGDMNGALEAYRLSLEAYQKSRDPSRSMQAAIQYDLGLCLYKNGREAEAVSAFEEACVLDPYSAVGSLSKIVLRVMEEQFVKASVELRRLEKHLNWESMEAIAKLKWKGSVLGALYQDYVKQCVVMPLVHAAILTGSEETLRRIVTVRGTEVFKGLDLSHPIYKLAIRPADHMLARLADDAKEGEAAQIIEGNGSEYPEVAGLSPTRQTT